MVEVTDEHVAELKERLHITHRSEDGRLKRMVEESYADIQAKTGPFSLDESRRGRELVYERCRYAYNDSVEYFDDNFLSQIMSFGLELYADQQRKEAGLDETTV